MTPTEVSTQRTGWITWLLTLIFVYGWSSKQTAIKLWGLNFPTRCTRHTTTLWVQNGFELPSSAILCALFRHLDKPVICNKPNVLKDKVAPFLYIRFTILFGPKKTTFCKNSLCSSKIPLRCGKLQLTPLIFLRVLKAETTDRKKEVQKVVR